MTYDLTLASVVFEKNEGVGVAENADKLIAGAGAGAGAGEETGAGGAGVVFLDFRVEFSNDSAVVTASESDAVGGANS